MAARDEMEPVLRQDVNWPFKGERLFWRDRNNRQRIAVQYPAYRDRPPVVAIWVCELGGAVEENTRVDPKDLPRHPEDPSPCQPELDLQTGREPW